MFVKGKGTGYVGGGAEGWKNQSWERRGEDGWLDPRVEFEFVGV